MIGLYEEVINYTCMYLFIFCYFKFMYNFNVDDECGDTVIILNIMNLFLLTTMVLQIGK